MRLYNILEGSLMDAETPVLNISKVFGRLIKLLYEDKKHAKSPATLLLKSLFKKPDTKSWVLIRDKFIKEVMNIINANAKTKAANADIMPLIAELSTFAPAVVVSSLFAIETKYLNMTDLRSMAQSNTDRAKTMKALQPDGWVTTFSNTAGMPHSVLKNFNKLLGANARLTAQELQKIYPNNRVNKF